jgi:hypothetical protein
MQYFSKTYSDKYLWPYLKRNGMYVQVYNGTTGQRVAEVVMKVCKGKDKRANVIKGWSTVVTKMQMKEDQIFMFWFRRTITGVKMIVERVQ